MGYRFNVISDELVECTDTKSADTCILTKEEAVLLGFKSFTYKGEPISVYAFAKMLGKDEGTVRTAICRHKLNTGEQVIEYYNNIKKHYDYSGFNIEQLAKAFDNTPEYIMYVIRTHQFKTEQEVIDYCNSRRKCHDYSSFDIDKLEKLLNRTAVNIMYAIRTHQLKTEQEVTDYYRKIDTKECSNFTYRGERITINKFAVLINRSACQIGKTIRKYKYTTGEQVIEHYNNGKGFHDYSNISTKKLAKMTNRGIEDIRDTVRRNNFTTEQDVINYCNNMDKKLTYKGETITIPEFAKILNKSSKTVEKIIETYGCNTGEQVIEQYRLSIHKGNRLTYKGVAISIKSFAEIIGKAPHWVSNVILDHKFTTGEQIIEYCNGVGVKKITYNGKDITGRDFARLIGKDESTIYYLRRTHKFTTGEQIIEYYKQKGKM